MARIILTGAAGFIGSHTAEALIADGHEVLGLDNLRTGTRENLASLADEPRFRLEETDICDGACLAKLTADFAPEAVIHLAALVSVVESIEEPALNFEINVRGTHHVAEAARRAGVRSIVFASSAAVYGEPAEVPIPEDAPCQPLSPYGAAKLASESILTGHAHSYGIKARFLRYFNVYGPRQDPSSPYSGVISIFADRLRAGQPVTIFGDGEQTRDFIHVADVARANLLAALNDTAPTGPCNIATGKQTSLNELYALMARSVPDAPAPIHASPRLGDIRHSVAQTAEAKDHLGFAFELTLRRGLISV